VQITLPKGVQVKSEVTPGFAEILTPDALAFVAKLQREFGPRRDEALQARQDRQSRFDAGEMADFLTATKQIREGALRCFVEGDDVVALGLRDNLPI
jgi:malate synthase